MTLSIVLGLNLIVILALILVQLFFYSSSYFSDFQLTSLESGFELIKHSSFLSSSFFLLAVIFVLFDMELILLFPFVFFYSMSVIKGLLLLSLFIFVTLTLFLEWSMIGLKWSS